MDVKRGRLSPVFMYKEIRVEGLVEEVGAVEGCRTTYLFESDPETL